MKMFGRSNSQMTKEEYIRDFRRSCSNNNFFWYLDGSVHTWLQFIIVVGAVVVPFLLNNSTTAKTAIPIIVSAVVAAAAALSNYFKFNERGFRRFIAFEEMSDELNSYDLREGLYSGLNEEEAFNLFFEQTKKIQRKYNQNIFFYDVSKQDQKNKSEENERPGATER